MKRGDIVVAVSRGAYTGKPRPLVVVQSDDYNDTHASVTLCPVTSDLADASSFRVPLAPGKRTGLTDPSQAMADKIVSVPRGAVDRTIGACSTAEMNAINEALRGWLDL